MIRRNPLLVLAAGLYLAGPIQADEITDQLDAARKAYEAGELRSAIETLNFTVARIQERMTANLVKLLPEPLPGWTADAPESQAGGMAAMITGTTLSRTYRRGDGAEIRLSLMADSPLMPMLTMALSMPFVIQNNPAMKTYSFQGYRGMLEHAADSQDYEITLMVGNRLVIQGKGSRLADSQPIEDYLKQLDLDAIRNALTQ